MIKAEELAEAMINLIDNHYSSIQDVANQLKEFAKQQGAGFMDWRNDVKNFDKNILRKNPDITSEELYEEYLKTL